MTPRAWTKAERARIGAATHERFAKAVRQFPEHHHKLRAARVAAGYTQAELASAAGLKSAMSVSRIERGVIQGSPMTQTHLAIALGVAHSELFG
jgi:DNA-binding XRE family transcriptional regulator